MTSTSPGPDSQPSYAGERLGLPARGSGSVAGWGRRIAALVVDWVACTAVAAVLVGHAAVAGLSLASFTPHLVFLVEASVLTTLLGGSFGQLLLRVRVTSLRSGTVSLLPALLRSLLILLVVPPVIFNRDNRGLHDLAAQTVTLLR